MVFTLICRLLLFVVKILSNNMIIFYYSVQKEREIMKNMNINIEKQGSLDISSKADMFDKFFLKSKSPAFNKCLSDCEKVAKSNVNVLLVGESGTGKDVAANYIHLCSSRCDKNMVAVNCSSYTESLLESELFGYNEGAFTGATKSKEGKIELSDKGTLFLDEIGDSSPATQLKLLRAIETRKIERIGSNMSRALDFRLICATNRDLKEDILNNLFREDFFYRISSIVIKVPSLKERKEDLPDMINFFLKKACSSCNVEIHKIEEDVLDFLNNYDYPGNIRELKNIIERLVVLSDNGVITKKELPVIYDINKNIKSDLTSESEPFDQIMTLREFKARQESSYLQWVLNQFGGNVAAAARKLDITPRQLFNKINDYSLKK